MYIKFVRVCAKKEVEHPSLQFVETGE